MPNEVKQYRRFSEDLKEYIVDDKTFKIKDVMASKMKELRTEMISIGEEYSKVKGLDRFKLQNRSIELSKKILEAGLEGFHYEEMSHKYSESELEGIAGELIGFLSVKRSQKEQSLLVSLSEETKNF